MYRSPFMSVISAVSIIASVVGIIFFLINPTVTVVCGILTFLNSIIQVIWGDQNNLSTEFITIIISIIIALIAKLSTFHVVCFALCLVETLMTIIGWIVMFVNIKKF